MNEITEHGGNIYKIAQVMNCKPEEIIDFSSNINPLKPEMTLSIEPKSIEIYGDPDYVELKEVIAHKYELNSSEIKLFNGASSAIFALFEQLDYSEVALYAPLYGEYKNAAEACGKKILSINRFDDIWEKPERNSLVVMVNPSTPDGYLYDFKGLLSEWKALNCQVIIDESFLEFTQAKSLREELHNYANLYIIQSFTKFYACAGLRVGAVFSHESNINKLYTPMWTISSVDVSLLLKIFADKHHHQKSTKELVKLRDRLRSILCYAQCFDEVYQSHANYILTKSKAAKKIEKILLNHKIMVRNCESFDFLDNRYLRFAVKDEKALDALEVALIEFHE